MSYSKLASLGTLLLSVSDVEAIRTLTNSEENISTLSANVQKQLSKNGAISGIISEEDLASLVNTEVREQVAEQETQKTNLDTDAKSKHHKKKSHKKHKAHNKAPPATTSLVSTVAKEQARNLADSQPVTIPIDEVKAITLQVSPTFVRDKVDSVTLKSFRKVIGYDTFNSILKKDRAETKDPLDHYNITVSMMVTRTPEDLSAAPTLDVYGPDGGKTLSQVIDKGFPYDDGDNTIDDAAPKFKRTTPSGKTLIGALNGQNITKESLQNLVRDTEVPITQELVQLESEISGDSDNVFKLMDANVTKGQMKNLITDKPSPITTKLAQITGDKDNVFKLMDANVTKGQMKNLITDKPSPITTKLAQVAGVPVGVEPTLKVNTMADATLGLKIEVGPDEIKLAKNKQASQALQQTKGVPVGVEPTLKVNTMADATLGLKIEVGPDEIKLSKKKQGVQQLDQDNGVPVHVKPVLMNNTMGDADLGLKMRVGGDEVKVEKKKPQQLQQKAGVPVHVNPTVMQNTMHDADLGMTMQVGPDEVKVEKKKIQQLQQKAGVPVHVNPTVMVNTMHDADLGMTMQVGPDEVKVAKKAVKQQSIAQDKGVPVLVDPVIAKPTGAEKAKLDVKALIGPDEVSAVQKEKKDKGVPVLVDPVIAKPTGAEKAKLDVKALVGPDEVSVVQKGKKDKGVPVLVNPVIAKPTGAESAKLDVKALVGPDEVSVVQKGAQAQIMHKVELYCQCMRSHAQKGNSTTYTVGESTCTPVSGVSGVDCTLDGFNVTTEALKNIVTDKPAPITRPLVAPPTETPSGFVATKLSQVKNDGSEEDQEEEQKEKDAANPKLAAAAAFGDLAKADLKKQGITDPEDAEKDKQVDPMKGEHMEITMSVGGAKVELTKAAHEAKKQAKADAEEKAAHAAIESAVELNPKK